MARLTVEQKKILNGDNGHPSPMGVKAEELRVGDRLDIVDRLGLTEPDPTRRDETESTPVGADLIRLYDPDGVLPDVSLGALIRIWASGISGTMPPVIGVPGAVVIEKAAGLREVRRLRANDVDPEASITSFTASVGVLVETGSTVSSPSFTAAYNVDVSDLTAASVVDDQGNAALDVLVSPEAFTYTNDYTADLGTPGDSVTWTLSAVEDGDTIEATATATSATRVFHGPAALPGSVDETFVESLATSDLATSLSDEYTETSSSGQYHWHAAPTRMGTPAFEALGNNAIWVEAGTVDVTNAYGYTEEYTVRRSYNAGLGAITWSVA